MVFNDAMTQEIVDTVGDDIESFFPSNTTPSMRR